MSLNNQDPSLLPIRDIYPYFCLPQIRLVLLIFECYLNEITQFVFCVWMASFDQYYVFDMHPQWCMQQQFIIFLYCMVFCYINTLCLFIHSTAGGHFSHFQFPAIRNNITCYYQNSHLSYENICNYVYTYLRVSSRNGYYAESQGQGQAYSNLVDIPKVFSKLVVPIFSPTTVQESCGYTTSSQTLGIVSIFNLHHSRLTLS